MLENARKRLEGKKVDGETPEEKKTARRKKRATRKALRKEFRNKKRKPGKPIFNSSKSDLKRLSWSTQKPHIDPERRTLKRK
jgi:hypothetical protein